MKWEMENQDFGGTKLLSLAASFESNKGMPVNFICLSPTPLHSFYPVLPLIFLALSFPVPKTLAVKRRQRKPITDKAITIGPFI